MSGIADSLSGTLTRSFDDLDRLAYEVTPNGRIDYGYDAASRRTSAQVQSQAQVTYAYDDASKLTGITQSSATVGFTYDASSRRTKLQLPNGIDVDYGYDDAGQLASLTYMQGSTTLGDLAYTYNEAGQRTAIGGSYARTNLPAAVASTTHDANNRVTNWGGTAFTYDDNGNLTSDGTRTYTWDVRNRLSALSSGVTASFAYDATGRRQSKTVSGTTTKFLYDGLNVIQELDGSLTPTANLLVGLGFDQTFIRTDSAARYLLPDALGSTLTLTDSSAATRTSYTYEPYGETTSSGDASTNAFQYTGRENDNTGLYYYRARYYQPGIKRFVSEDPIGLIGGPNLYSYVRGNPLSFTDPLGLQATGGAGGQSSGGSSKNQNCQGPDCKQSYFDCLANCIRTNDPLNDLGKLGLTGLGGTFPKAWVGLPQGLGGASSLTTVPSAAAYASGGGAAGTAGAIARGVGRVFSPIWIGYGLGMVAVEGMCAIACAQDACMY